MTATITATEITAHLENMTAVELRKLGGTMGIKGASKGKKVDLVAAIAEIRIAEAAVLAAVAAPVVTETKTPKAKCIVCGVRNGMTAKQAREQGLGRDYRDMCVPCYDEGGWENSHSDANHEAILEVAEADRTAEQAAEIDGCWICFPELNEAKKAPRAGRSRAGMVIVAKGTEIHKSATFKAAAEAAGWTVTMQSETYELGDDAEGEGTRYFATATRGGDSISLAWDGRAYDYPASSAQLAGKARKIRNLKEALRVL